MKSYSRKMARLAIFAISVAMLCAPMGAFAADSSQSWIKAIGNAGDNSANALIERGSDGIYVLANTSVTGGDIAGPVADYSGFVMGIGKDGALGSAKTYEGAMFSPRSDILATKDGGYITTGRWGSGEYWGTWVIKEGGSKGGFDTGRIEGWGSSGIVETPSGEFIITGATGGSPKKPFLRKIGVDGITVWNTENISEFGQENIEGMGPGNGSLAIDGKSENVVLIDAINNKISSVDLATGHKVQSWTMPSQIKGTTDIINVENDKYVVAGGNIIALVSVPSDQAGTIQVESVLDLDGKVQSLKKLGNQFYVAGSIDQDGWAAQVDLKDNVFTLESEKIVAFSGTDTLNDVIRVSNGDVYAVGATNSKEVPGYKGGDDALVVKFSEADWGTEQATIGSPELIDAQAIKIDKASLSMEVGTSQDLSVEVYPNVDANKVVTWKTSNPTVATVDQNGKVTAVKGGSAYITATTTSGKVAGCTVAVMAEVEKITIDQTSLVLEVKEKAKLNGKAEPLTAKNKDITWSSSNNSAVTVKSNGMLTAVSPGTSVITASTANGKSMTCTVTVLEPIQWMNLTPSDAAVHVGKVEQLKPTSNSDLSKRKGLEWSISDTSVATVDQTGKVTGKKPGTAVVKLKAKSGQYAEATVRVSIPINSIAINPVTLMMGEGQSANIKATLSPANATIQNVSWESSDTEIATIDDNGTIKALTTGAVTITANAGGKVAVCKVTVVCGADGIELTPSAVKLNALSSYKLVANIISKGLTDGKLTWTTSDKSVVNVNGGNLLAGNKSGTATVTVATSNGKTATCQVTVVVPVSSIKVNQGKDVVMALGEEKKLDVLVYPSHATDPKVTWTNGNNIVSISEDGTVKALAVGKTTIYANPSEGTNRGASNITVLSAVDTLAIDANPTVSGEAVEVRIAGTIKLLANVNGDTKDPRPVEWKAINPAIAKVDANGIVTGVAKGVTTVTANVGGKVAEITVNVFVPTTSMTLSPTSKTILVGGTTKLVATITPTNATYNKAIWSTSNSKIATVDENGIVTGVSKGIANITASTEDGRKVSAVINVYSAIDKLSLESGKLTLVLGEKAKQIDAIASPDEESLKSLTWASANTGIVKVDQSGNVTPVAKGTVDVTATAPNGMKVTCKVTVVVKVNSVALNVKALTVRQGEKATLVATINPSNADNTALIWTSANPSIATVDEYGVVTGQRTGKAIIYATTSDKNKVASCTVTVIEPLAKVTSVYMDKVTLNMGAGETYKLSATVLPSHAGNKQVTFTSDNPTIVKTNAGGNLTALSPGTATITATSVDGQKTATCVVTVGIGVTEVKLSSSTLTITEGETAQLTSTVLAKEANQEVVWSSANPMAVRIDDTGKLTGIAAGKAIITVTTVDNNKTATCTVTVERGPTKITLDKTSFSLESGKAYKLLATITPTTVNNKTVTWKSDDTGIATVNNEGIVTAVGAGKATITATTVNGKMATATVTVTGTVPVVPTPTEETNDYPRVGDLFSFEDSKGIMYTLKVTGDWENVYNKVTNDYGIGLGTGYVYTDGKEDCVYISLNNPYMQRDTNKGLTLKDLYNRNPSAFIKVQDGHIVKTLADTQNGAWKDNGQKKGTLYIEQERVFVAPSDVNKNTTPPGGWVTVQQ